MSFYVIMLECMWRIIIIIIISGSKIGFFFSFLTHFGSFVLSSFRF